MLKQITLIFNLVILIFQNAASADTGRALKLLEKKEYDKLVEYLNKDIEKDSINPGAKYVYSLLYLDSAFGRFNIDSSYFFINHSLNDLSRLEEKDIKKLENDGINDSTLNHHRQKIEMTAFTRSKMGHTLQSYNFFIDNFQDALQFDSAIYYRNEIAYEKAVETNTFEAFQDFIYTYPDAIRIEEAKANYERLLFSTMTQDGNLETYIRFLKNNPNTPHRNEAERNILEIAAADNKIESYEWFILQYPKSVHTKKAMDLLYHRYKEDHSGQEAINKYTFFSRNDSLKSVATLENSVMFPVFENGLYGFFNAAGDRIIDFSYDSIAHDLLCGKITKDYFEVSDDGKKSVIARNGFVIFDEAYEEVEDIGSGWLKVKHQGKYGLVHKTGFRVLDFEYEEIELLAKAYVRVKQKEKWGLMSLTGRQILPIEYDEIAAENEFIAIRKDDYFAISSVNELKSAAEGKKITLFFSYDDYFLIDDIHLVAISDDKEALIDENLKIVSKLEDHEILRFFDGWIEKSDKGYRIYDLIYYPLSGENYERVLIDSKKIAFRLNGIWGIYFEGSNFSQNLDYDSIHFLSKTITLLFKGQKLVVSFDTDSMMTFEDYANVRLIRPQSGIENPENMPSYLSITNKKGITEVFDQKGLAIIKGKYAEIEAVGKEYLVVTKNDKKGLFLYNGKELLNAKYQGLSNYDQGYISTMLNNKFGIYHFKDDLLLSAKHDKILKTYGTAYFISLSNDKLAFVNRDNDFITDFEFDKVEYWNDTTAMVQSEGKWKLFDIKNRITIYDEIEVFKPLLKDSRETIYLINKEGQVGLLSNARGEVIAPTFNDIYNVGTAVEPVFFAEKYIPEADFYIVIYYDKTGHIIRKQVFDEVEYWKVYCEDPEK